MGQTRYIEKCKYIFFTMISGFQQYEYKVLKVEKEIAKSHNEVEKFNVYWQRFLNI